MRARSLVLSLSVATILLVGQAASATIRVDERSPSPSPLTTYGLRQAPDWRARIDALIGGRSMSVAIGNDGTFWYRRLATVPRIPASNEKLLLSMALLDRLPAGRRIATRAMAVEEPVDGVLAGDLWLAGNGDPEIDRDRLSALAQAVVDAGILRVDGSVVADTGPFERDWWAVGWRDYFQADEVPFPTALTFEGNVGPGGGHIDDPERRAAAWLTRELRGLGVPVAGKPRMEAAPDALRKIAMIRSDPLIRILGRMNEDSLNFDAEVLAKFLGAQASGVGSIETGAAAIDAFTAANGAPGFEHHDGSGLSYANRVTTQGIVKLLWAVGTRAWAPKLRFALPTTGQGTLEGRLFHVRVRAKTGTLSEISALSGWVWNRTVADWIEFSIVSFGLDKSTAIDLEDAIAAIAMRDALPPADQRSAA
jgi:D-alanyl-D-alanine carboxypeptidase/D-alanyl-D-alanine-endopeptidase (penicillin-binding protein 4)